MAEVKSTDGFGTAQRQHALGLLLLLGLQTRLILRMSWPLLIAFYFQGDREARFFLWAMAGLAGVAFVAAMLHFARFTFRVQEGQLQVRKGILVRDKTNIPLERVQAVHVEQNLLQRLFGVCGLRIDTASSKGAELTIHALPWDKAHALRSMLTSENVSSDSLDAEDLDTAEKAPSADPLLSLDWKTLVQVGLSQNHLSKVALAIGGLATFQGIAWDVIGNLWSSVPTIYRTVLWFLSPLLVLLSPVVIATIAVGASLVTTVFKHWKLTLWVQGGRGPQTASLHVTQGLLNRQSFQVPIHKIQWVRWENTWIRRLLSMDTLEVRQASAGGGSGGASAADGGGSDSMRLVVPAMNGDRTQKMVGLLFPTWPEQKLLTLRPTPYAFRIRWFKRGLAWMPVAIAAGWGLGTAFGTVVGLLLWTTVGAWSRKWHQGQWATTDGRHLSVHSGWLFRQRVMMDWTKLQAVEWHQNRIHEKRGVAHLTFHTSSGVAHLRYLPTSLALQLKDLANARVVAHKGAWM